MRPWIGVSLIVLVSRSQPQQVIAYILKPAGVPLEQMAGHHSASRCKSY